MFVCVVVPSPVAAADKTVTTTVLLSAAATDLLTGGLRGRIGVLRTLVAQMKDKAPAEFNEFLETLAAISLSCVFGDVDETTGDLGQQLATAVAQLIDERWSRLCSAAVVGGYDKLTTGCVCAECTGGKGRRGGD